MPHQTGGSAVYRLLVRSEGRVRVYGSRTFPSLDAALAAVCAAVHACPRVPEAVLVQRGISLTIPSFDPHGIVPGERGGWTDIDWDTVEELQPALLRDLHDLPRPEHETVPYRSQRPAVLAGLAVVAIASIGLLSMQSSSGPGGIAWAGGTRTAQVTELPFSNAWVKSAEGDTAEQTARNELEPNTESGPRTAERRTKPIPTGF